MKKSIVTVIGALLALSLNAQQTKVTEITSFTIKTPGWGSLVQETTTFSFFENSLTQTTATHYWDYTTWHGWECGQNYWANTRDAREWWNKGVNWTSKGSNEDYYLDGVFVGACQDTLGLYTGSPPTKWKNYLAEVPNFTDSSGTEYQDYLTPKVSVYVDGSPSFIYDVTVSSWVRVYDTITHVNHIKDWRSTSPGTNNKWYSLEVSGAIKIGGIVATYNASTDKQEVSFMSPGGMWVDISTRFVGDLLENSNGARILFSKIENIEVE